MTLDKKILSGFAGCSVILLVVAVFSFRNSEEVLESGEWVSHSHEVLYELEQILVYSLEASTGARGFVVTGNENYLDPFYKAKANLSEHITRAKDLTQDNPTQLRNINRIEEFVRAYIAHLDQYIVLRRRDFESARNLIVSGDGKRTLDEIRQVAASARQHELELLAERKLDSEESIRDFNLVFAALLAIIVLVLTAIYLLITANLRALRRAEREANDKNWTLTGSGDLALSIQGNIDIKDLAQTVIRHLATYLHAQVGNLYVTDDDGLRLQLMGTYSAGKATSHAGAPVNFGEGLAGQCAADKRLMVIHDVPEKYLTIHAGFGDITPKNIMLCPFIFEDTVTGVVEIASIHDFTGLQQNYVKLVMDSVAVAVVSARNRSKVQTLLEETQRQAEELAAQQEELRQANEELHAKTEMLENSELELKEQQRELQQVNVELEEKANELEDQKAILEGAKAEIEKKAHEVELTSRYKSEFLANMSHELRTPLNSILILSQLLYENKNNRLDKKEVEFARNINKSGQDLLTLINDILDLSKVESGKVQLEISDVPFGVIIDSLHSTFGEVARSKSIRFNIDFRKDDLPATIKTDSQRVEQILKNLLSNAFKFTNEGGEVSVTVRRPASGSVFRSKFLLAKDCVSFIISDTGMGIPPEKQASVFEAFQQADGSTKRKYGGTGLGLSISRELAHVLGGEIHLESEEGKGSTFTLYLPVDYNPSFIVTTDKEVEVREKIMPAREVAASVAGNGSTIQHSTSEGPDEDDDRHDIQKDDRVILIIEDDESFAKILLDFVRERGYKGIITRQGTTGISYARHYRPDAILLDMKLPVMDGTAVLKQMKSDPDLRHIPVQIISAFDNRKEGMALGAIDYIRKPATTTMLRRAFDRIEKFVNTKYKRLLIVEDDRLQSEAISELIGNGDVVCSAAYSGNEAFEMLSAESFDCVIVDLGLPDMSGFSLLEKIRTHDTLNKIPVIVYTGKDLGKEEHARLTKLADTVVLKTAESHERLLDETILFLHRVEARLPKEKQRLVRKLYNGDEILQNKKILLVDDDMRNIYSLTNALEGEGIYCLTAENGKVALEVLKSNPDVDLVLMDVMMPEMDGYETTGEIRKMNEFSRLPIIALTAKAMKGDKEKCLAAGMSDYISKPVNVEQLLSLIRVWLYK